MFVKKINAQYRLDVDWYDFCRNYRSDSFQQHRHTNILITVFVDIAIQLHTMYTYTNIFNARII